jgi:hypothetical protein
MTTLPHSDRRVHLRSRRNYFDDGDSRRLPPAWVPPPNALWAFPDGFEASFAELLNEAQAAYHLAGQRTQKLIRAARRYYFEDHGTIPPLTDHETTLLVAIADRGADLRAEELKPLVETFLKAMENRGLTYEQRVEKHIAWLAQRMKETA